ncbi:GH25 family lysozyme M1 (1,4-beta-N-acetylmuramidase) [Amycolatopsis sulphurea]|uniref:lysozyme n=1 Tax=Amycolatopsis sulphurea TaxID=76022 RepID=A0A2A9FAY7_9PSEU|nr:lysozyme [Amycolatopsis sulphurea]PFG48587.1 GH25 family lysozyme M1 (1,4-beta-N-acetylmuramidase) [Amycolatopsis sulphurea]
MSTPRRGRRSTLFSALTIPVVALLLGASTQASAAPDTTGIATINADIQAHNHTMGSQIRRVEGDQSTPQSRTAAQRPQPAAAAANQVLATVAGMDVASYQRNVDWASWWNQGKRFVWTKATESTNYTNPYFAQQYNGSYDQGFIRGAYHFATPNTASGAAQANYFVAHGGGWSGDGKTLPGALDMEYNPYGATCYGLSKPAMTAWIKDFHDTYHAKTGRWPVIYTSASWWNQCVDGDFSATAPLWVARYASSVGALPSGWGVYTVWQYTSSPLDQDTFNGAYDRLQALANG